MKLDFESNTTTFTPIGSDFLNQVEPDNHSAEVSKMLREGIEAAQNGRPSEARNLLLRVTEVDANNEKAWLWLASISEYPEELLVFLNSVLKINPANERALEWSQATKSLLSKTFVQRGIDASGEQEDFAKQCFFQAIVHDNENEMAWLWLASISPSDEEKSEYLEKVLNINPDNLTAKSLFESIHQKNREMMFQKAVEFAANGENYHALDALQDFFNQSPNSENAWLLKSFLVQSFEEKLECFEQVLQANPDNELAQMNAAFLRSMMEKSKVEKTEATENDVEMSVPEEVAVESPIHFFTENVVEETEEEVFAPEAETEEEVFASPEHQFAEEAQAENNPMPELEVPQYSMPENEEECLITDEVDSEVEDYAPQTYFEQPQAHFEQPQAEFETPQTHFEEPPQMQFEEPQVEEMKFAEAESNEAMEDEAQAQFSDEAETETGERGYAFYEVEEKAEENTDNFVEQNSYSEEKEDDIFSEYENKSQDYENVEELPQVYAFQDSEVSAQPEFADDENESNEVQEAKDDSEVSMETHSPFAETESAENDSSQVYEIEQSESVAENNYSHIFGNTEDSVEDSAASFEETVMNFGETVSQTEEQSAPSVDESASNFDEQTAFVPQVEMVACSFCNSENEAQSLVCPACRAVLSFADLEMVLANHEADKEMIGNTVCQMEAEKERRNLESDEMKQLALGYLNLQNSAKGLYYLNQAAKLNPNDIVLSSQVNALKIRLSEIEKQKDVHESMPKNLTILIVDDSATVRKLISSKLEKSGHEVICAIDGIDALEKIKEIVPDLVLLDINMPRMDGYQVCKMIRSNEATKDVPVVMISGKDGFFDKVRGRMAGTTGYITKPFGPETLMKTVETYIV